ANAFEQGARLAGIRLDLGHAPLHLFIHRWRRSVTAHAWASREAQAPGACHRSPLEPSGTAPALHRITTRAPRHWSVTTSPPARVERAWKTWGSIRVRTPRTDPSAKRN